MPSAKAKEPLKLEKILEIMNKEALSEKPSLLNRISIYTELFNYFFQEYKKQHLKRQSNENARNFINSKLQDIDLTKVKLSDLTKLKSIIEQDQAILGIKALQGSNMLLNALNQLILKIESESKEQVEYKKCKQYPLNLFFAEKSRLSKKEVMLGLKDSITKYTDHLLWRCYSFIWNSSIKEADLNVVKKNMYPCLLHKVDTLPENLETYKDSFIYFNKKLFYVNSHGLKKKIPLTEEIKEKIASLGNPQTFSGSFLHKMKTLPTHLELYKDSFIYCRYKKQLFYIDSDGLLKDIPNLPHDIESMHPVLSVDVFNQLYPGKPITTIDPLIKRYCAMQELKQFLEGKNTLTEDDKIIAKKYLQDCLDNKPAKDERSFWQKISDYLTDALKDLGFKERYHNLTSTERNDLDNIESWIKYDKS